ncbi:MAG TPA: hypothetical protein VIA18_27650 [Polyangia bacterium]|nr:hypothetical protein [Polyangia bacterium]
MPMSVVADVALAAILALFVELLSRLRAAELRPTPPWWLGYAHDGTNVAAALVGWCVFLGVGYAPAVAFLAASLTALLTYMLDWTFADGLRLRHPRLALLAILTAWVTAVTLWPAPVSHALWRMLDIVQPVAR